MFPWDQLTVHLTDNDFIKHLSEHVDALPLVTATIFRGIDWVDYAKYITSGRSQY